jgi:hypothetical protein
MSNFIPLDLTSLFNASRDSSSWHPMLTTELAALPTGRQTFWGIPFQLGPAQGNGWIEIGESAAARDSEVDGRGSVRVSLASDQAGTQISHLVFAHFCDGVHGPTGRFLDYGAGDDLEPGEHLADYVLVYGDGSEHCQAIRRRFEVNELIIPQWLLLPFAARPHTAKEPRAWQGSHQPYWWGFNQTGIGDTPAEGYGRYWIYALPNPHPERPLVAVRLEACGASRVVVAGISLYDGPAHPLRHERLESFRVKLPEPMLPGQVAASVDLGVIARAYAVPAFDPESWLADDRGGCGEPPAPSPQAELFLDITASRDATLSINGQAIALGPAYAAAGADSPPVPAEDSGGGQMRVEVLTPHKTWLHGRVVDATTGKAVAARLHFRAPDGRYLPPYGHRHEVNDHWFQDYGADLKLGSTQYAYVDGEFQAELPTGEVYVEITKGLEYAPVRRRVEIRPGQRELVLEIERPLNWRRQGWVTADTHVHFLSPQTAWLEAQAEGVNLVNLLAAQWGDLFTNVGDLTGGQSGVSRDDTVVWVGTENRQHLLGHISLLGGQGQPAYPLSAGGPDESYLGDPQWTSLAEWADRCRERDGLVVMPHFPYPYCEAAADIVLGKVDAAELRFFNPTLDTFNVREWYRFLNLGYRLASVGGTDKMTAGVPVGASRTYANLGDEEFCFANWAKAVRAGRTFTTTGPLLDIRVDGRPPGAEIKMPQGGGTVEVEAHAESVLPFDELQIVVGGKVIARQQSERTQPGARASIHERVRLTDSAWVAARCASANLIWLTFMPTCVAAHTSPVYVSCGDSEVFSPTAATYMLTLIDGGLTWLDTLSVPASAEHRKRIRAVFEAARSTLEGRVARHSHSHPDRGKPEF